jgi:hypothetical protein
MFITYWVPGVLILEGDEVAAYGDPDGGMYESPQLRYLGGEYVIVTVGTRTHGDDWDIDGIVRGPDVPGEVLKALPRAGDMPKADRVFASRDEAAAALRVLADAAEADPWWNFFQNPAAMREFADVLTRGEGVSILDPSHPRVQALLGEVPLETRAVLFMADRWRYVDRVVVAAMEGQDVGLATLAPSNDMGQGGPHIIGVWVRPEQRRNGYCNWMLRLASADSLWRHNVPPQVVAVTSSGLLSVEAACAAGVVLKVVSVVSGMSLP